jgi:aminoglycoside phosphotransferase (APT) family kinase protein
MPDSVDEPGLLEALRACGLLAAGDPATLQPLTGGVSSDVFRVETGDGRTLVAKRSIPRLRVREEWLAPVERIAGEVRWLKLARSIDPRLAPAVLGECPEAHVFAMEFLDPATHPVWKDEMAAGRVDPAFAAAVGRDLALIHARTASRADIAAAFDTYDFFFALRVSPFLLFTADRHPDVAARLRSLADDLRRRRVALMHGDVSPKNILVGPGGPVFLDAETTAYGDPAFDLAFCLTHLLLKTVWLRPQREAVMASFDALRAAYAAGLSWEPPKDLSARTAALVAALLLARIDGKSPAPYLSDAADKDFVRRSAKALLSIPELDLEGLSRRWRQAALS